MRRIRIDHPGDPSALVLGEDDVPVPGPGEVLVRHEAIGVNYIDVYYRDGTYPAPRLPFTPGMEAAGIVEACGDDTEVSRPSEFHVGDRVAYAQTLGAYADYAVVPAAKLVAGPDGVSADDAAAVMLQGMTAHYLSHATYRLTPTDYALVHAGAGGVGLLLTQFAKDAGAHVVTTISTEEKAALSRAAGADLVVDYTREDFVRAARAFADDAGVHVVYDSVGKTTFEHSLEALRPRGMLVAFGASSGPVPPVDVQTLNRKGSLFLTRPTLANYAATTLELRERAGACFAALARHRLRLRIGATFALADAAAAHRALEGRGTTGKVLLRP